MSDISMDWERIDANQDAIGNGRDLLAELEAATKQLAAAEALIKQAAEDRMAHRLYEFLLSEFRDPDPTHGEAVTQDIRPMFNWFCNLLAEIDAYESASNG